MAAVISPFRRGMACEVEGAQAGGGGMTWVKALDFDRSSQDFVDGFQCGRLWNQLSTGDESYEGTFYVSNAEMLLRIAEATERTLVTEELDGRWLQARFSERVE
jgi:hypothetical protein